MKHEIERKFLVAGEGWRGRGEARELVQGYLASSEDLSVRVRIAGEAAFLTIKGRTTGAARPEYEYPIPLDDARDLLRHLCSGPLVEKVRHRVEHAGLTWEVDEFSGDNAGLILAEVELDSHDQAVDLPDWVGEEVTDDPRYYNANLARHPYREWADKGTGC